MQREMDERGWTQSELAEIIGRPGRLISEIVAGKRGITPDTAHEFGAAFGTPAQFWMDLDTAYQLSRVKPAAGAIARKAQLRQRFPVREMMKRGWIKPASTDDDLEREVLSFFRLKALGDQVNFDHAARRNYATSLSPSQEAWLFRLRQIAEALQVPKYSENALRSAISDELQVLMTEPEEVRHVPRVLAECGVRFVIVEPIPGSRIDGACFWLDGKMSPVIGLSLKGGDQIDRFWFNLRHELEHVLRGDGQQGVVIDDFEDLSANETDAERAANEAAADYCVPSAKMKDFVARHHPLYSEQSLVGFSRIVKRHPGLVAGQIQRRLNRWDIFRKHQTKVRQFITQTALTDGYGKNISL